jgi:2-(1,2-epoxy-1,2-dihydrophenyl)acetyl-CoA isomerase
MNYTTIEFEKKGPVGILSLNRPETLNALSPDMKTDLMACMHRAADDDDLAVMIITGKGRAFSAGGDLNNFKRNYEAWRQGRSDATIADHNLPKAFIDFPKPMIAAINGPAVGFGLTVSLICDIRISSDQAMFSCAFVRIGVTPEFGSSYFLPRLVGYGKAMELALTAENFDAYEALRIGLVNRVTPHAELMSEAMQMAEIIGQFPRQAVLKCKALFRHGYHSTLDQVMQYEGLTFRHLTQTEDHYRTVCDTLARISKAKG